MSIRLEFVAEVFARRRSVAALCAQYGISEKTGYKWLARFRAHGPAGLTDAPHTPHGCPHQTPAVQRELLCATRREHPTWGARKLREVLAAAHPALAWPAPSTITTLLDRAGLVQRRARRRAPSALGTLGGTRGPAPPVDAPNALWTMDYKGQFRTGDGRWCYPLTIVDAHSRFLLAGVAHRAPATQAVHAVLADCFRTYGLPAAILSDNGPPFGAPRAPRGFSRLTLWLRTLDITPHFIVPGHPEHNGRHERLHRTLKRDVLRPPAASLRTQQARFDAFRHTYNTTRPHEALGQTPPAAHFVPSTRPYPVRPLPIAYPPHFLERRVTSAGLVWVHHEDIYVSQTFAGYTVGLDPVSPTQWDVYFAEYLLGALDLTTLRFRSLTRSLTSPITPV
jgi:transposase InsO family protein